MGRGPRAYARRAVFDRGLLVSIGFILTPAFPANCVGPSGNSALVVKGAIPNVAHQKPNLAFFSSSLASFCAKTARMVSPITYSAA